MDDNKTQEMVNQLTKAISRTIIDEINIKIKKVAQTFDVYGTHYQKMTIMNEDALDGVMHYGRHGFVVVSVDNKEDERNLLNDIRDRHYTFTPIFGRCVDENEKVSYSTSYIIYNYKLQAGIDMFCDLVEFAIEMCNKYNQKVIFAYQHSRKRCLYDREGNQLPLEEAERVFNRPQERFFLTIRRKNHYSTDEFTADFANVLRSYKYTSINAIWVRRLAGERYFTDLDSQYERTEERMRYIMLRPKYIKSIIYKAVKEAVESANN